MLIKNLKYKLYDIIIIGGGISGLYCKKSKKNNKVALFDEQVI